MSTGFLYEILKCLLMDGAGLGGRYTRQISLRMPFFAYIGGYSTNIGFCKHLPNHTDGLGTLLFFPILVE